jgi:hypothetical protein
MIERSKGVPTDYFGNTQVSIEAKVDISQCVPLIAFLLFPFFLHKKFSDLPDGSVSVDIASSHRYPHIFDSISQEKQRVHSGRPENVLGQMPDPVRTLGGPKFHI